MKKAYIVAYVNDKEGINLNLMRDQLRAIGMTKELAHGARTALWFLIPEDEAVSAATIKNRIFSSMNPFEDSIRVIRIDANDVAETNGLDSTEFLSQCKDSHSDEPINYSRFKSRHEAYLQYRLEKPIWVYDDGIPNGIVVDFSDWCWLPIKKDGMYEKRKYEKYING